MDCLHLDHGSPDGVTREIDTKRGGSVERSWTDEGDVEMESVRRKIVPPLSVKTSPQPGINLATSSITMAADSRSNCLLLLACDDANLWDAGATLAVKLDGR